MCSVFGFISSRGRTANAKTLDRIVRANIRRGPHAFGFAWVSGKDGRLRSYRQVGNLLDYRHLLALTKDAIAMIGHLRFATHGDPKHQINNHPHPCDGGWMVHNGVVTNYLELCSRHALLPVSDCDSETLAALAETLPGKTYLDRCASAVGKSRGNCVTLSLWNRPRVSLIAIRRGNPLQMAEAAEGTYLATTFPHADDATNVPDNSGQAYIFDKDRHDADLFTRSVESDHHLPSFPVRTSLFEGAGGGKYQGG